jgi:hypothetical protein
MATKSEAESAEIAAPRASASFWELVDPPTHEGDIQGWLIFQAPRRRRAQSAEDSQKRLMGFEPTTFCMAIAPVDDARWLSIQ